MSRKKQHNTVYKVLYGVWLNSRIDTHFVRRFGNQMKPRNGDILCCCVLHSVSVAMMMALYKTLNTYSLCGACCVIVRSPPPTELIFRFSDEVDFQSSLTEYTNSVNLFKRSRKIIGRDVANFDVDFQNLYENINCSRSIDLFCVKDDDINTEELVFGRFKEQNNKSRLNKFIGGRVALRRALKQINRGDSPSIFRDEFGAPLIPDGITGSISHKDYIAVGAAAVDPVGRIGVDIERTFNKAAPLLSRRLLTQREQRNLGNLPGIPSEEEVLLRFSFKESVFKAIHPFLKRPVGFNEVEIEPKSDGTAEITFLLDTNGSFKYTAEWRRQSDEYWLTCVYLTDHQVDDSASLMPS